MSVKEKGQLEDSQIEQIVAPIVRERLRKFGVEATEVSSGEDHDGDPIIHIIVRYREDAPEMDPRLALDTAHRANTALQEAGESRFAVMKHRYLENGE